MEFLGKPSKQKRFVKSTIDTKEKVMLTNLAAIFSKSSLEIGKEMLDHISELVCTILREIKSNENVLETLDMLIDCFSSEKRQKFFSTSRTSCSNNFLKETKKELDSRLQEHYQKSMKKLEIHDAKSPETILSIDYSSDLTNSKYLNDQYSYSVVGQQNTWQRAFTFSAIYDNTHQLFISHKHLNYHKSKHEYGDVQDFIKQLQQATKRVYDSGSHVKFINADRGFYDAELFAAAHLNEISALCPQKHEVKVITPKILYKDKEAQKKTFLENPSISQVRLTTIGLSKYTHPALIAKCKDQGIKRENSIYRIPVVEVALVDEYNSKKNRTVDALRKDWETNYANLSSSAKRLGLFDKEYLKEQKNAGIADPKPVPTKGRYKRKHFKTSVLKDLYTRIKKTREYIKKLKRDKANILKSVTFFTISITKRSVQRFNSDKYVEIAKVYHERWGIENGFRDEKQKFLRSCRLRKSTGRQFNYLIGLMLYNDWHVQRIKRMLKIERKRAWNKKPYDPRHPYLRRKFERKHRRILSAESYLLQVLFSGLKKRTLRIMSEI